ncbi:protein-L-isoaspartate O-methyltransferase-domain-containing protein [Xylogone sp. PMI_703]|nr:protein-L-isoaspartate O-methyltransferase-domain-containing protein [Xylogone sp. PMI_703]
MAWYCSGNTNSELVNNMWKHGLITSERVKEAMLRVDRGHFCPTQSEAYQDSPQPIGHSATISAPHMHASACEALLPYLNPGARVLDIGSGSGYLTAVLAELVFDVPPNAPAGDDAGDGGQIIGIEHIPELAKLGEDNMMKSPRGSQFLKDGRVVFVVGDGRKGYIDVKRTKDTTAVLDTAPQSQKEFTSSGWDVIHVGAAARTLHEELVRQLKAPGRMFIPVEDEEEAPGGLSRWIGGGSQYIWVVDKDKDGNVKKTRKEGVRYVPLTDPPR